jgi:hypothetical protein
MGIEESGEQCTVVFAQSVKEPTLNSRFCNNTCKDDSALLLFFSWIIFLQASDNSIRAISNFFENSQRY